MSIHGNRNALQAIRAESNAGDLADIIDLPERQLPVDIPIDQSLIPGGREGATSVRAESNPVHPETVSAEGANFSASPKVPDF